MGQYANFGRQERALSHHSRIQCIEAVDAVEVLEELGVDLCADPEHGQLSVLDEVNAVRLHANVARPHERRRADPLPIVLIAFLILHLDREAVLLAEPMQRNHARVEQRHDVADSETAQLPHIDGAHVRGDVAALDGLGLVHGERVEREELKRLWQDQLAWAGRRRAVAPVSQQNSHAFARQVVSNLLERFG